MKRAVLYLRVSTADQTTANQERELREIAGRVYKDHGMSGANLMPSAETPHSRTSMWW
jgi:DNA invertase Pin-like site-specific DNA recombinase